MIMNTPNEFNVRKGELLINVKILDGERLKFDVISGGKGTVHTDLHKMIEEIERSIGGETKVTKKDPKAPMEHTEHHHHH
jgi:hypothetical protein